LYGHEKYSTKPFQKGGAGFVEYGSRRQGCLIAATFALIKRSPGMEGILLISAFGTDKTFTPPGFEQVFLTGSLVGELPVKLKYIHGNRRVCLLWPVLFSGFGFARETLLVGWGLV